MLAFFSIIANSNDDFTQSNGTLFNLPAELSDRHRIQQYLKVSGPGWFKSEFGYMLLCRVDNFGNRYILPGLYLTDEERPAKRFPDHKPLFSRRQVENYLENHLERLVNVRSDSEEELTALVHDLRHLSSSIYHSAHAASHAVSDRKYVEAKELIQTIIATQTMLKVRIDYLDFSNSVERFDEIEKIPVYSRVHKVIRCFEADAKHKRIEIERLGESYRQAEGPNILDIVPYTLIENAVKYAPEKTSISVSVRDSGEHTIVKVTSLGPEIADAEKARIFEKGFRGKEAITVRKSGTGLGLAVAKSVAEIFGGSISVTQFGPVEQVQGNDYMKTEFEFALPTSGEDNVKKEKALRLKKRRTRRTRNQS